MIRQARTSNMIFHFNEMRNIKYFLFSLPRKPRDERKIYLAWNNNYISLCRNGSHSMLFRYDQHLEDERKMHVHFRLRIQCPLRIPDKTELRRKSAVLLLKIKTDKNPWYRYRIEHSKRRADRNGAVNRRILSTFLCESATNDTIPNTSGFDTGKARG